MRVNHIHERNNKIFTLTSQKRKQEEEKEKRMVKEEGESWSNTYLKGVKT